MNHSRGNSTWGPLIIGGVILVGIGLFVAGLVIQSAKNRPAGTSVQQSILEIRADDHVRGNATSTVTLVEYSDFQCPACRQYSGLVRQLEREGIDFRLVYRHFPLRQNHAHADIAARATEAAAIQDPRAFWLIHDILFDNQTLWSDNNSEQMRNAILSYPRIAIKDILNPERFEAELDSEPVRQRVARDEADARILGLNATPTFFINGERITNPATLDEFRAVLESYRKEI